MVIFVLFLLFWFFFCGILLCKVLLLVDLVVFYLGMYLIVFGFGGLKFCLLSLGVDQFDEMYEKECCFLVVYFNWYFFSFVVGGFLGVIVFVYIQDNIGYDVGYGICFVLVVVSLVVFVVGFYCYR